jgi:cytochrome c-type protein NapC
MNIDKLKGLAAGALRRIHATGWIGVAVLFVAGIFCWIGFNYALETTNTEEFCISCHEMKDNSYAEYRLTTHASSRSGVRASCPDCHVPKSFGPKMVAKMRASKDVYHNILGTIDTPEKFNARRLHMAEAVWERMKATDSRECRGCHDDRSFDYVKQSRRSAQMHQEGLNAGQTCIDCHKGVAHRLPNVEQAIGAEKGGAPQEIFHPAPPAGGAAGT